MPINAVFTAILVISAHCFKVEHNANNVNFKLLQIGYSMLFKLIVKLFVIVFRQYFFVNLNLYSPRFILDLIIIVTFAILVTFATFVLIVINFVTSSAINDFFVTILA